MIKRRKKGSSNRELFRDLWQGGFSVRRAGGHEVPAQVLEGNFRTLLGNKMAFFGSQ